MESLIYNIINELARYLNREFPEEEEEEIKMARQFLKTYSMF